MLVGLPCWLQIAILVVMIDAFTDYFVYFYWFCIVVTVLVVLWIVRDPQRPGL